MGRRKGDEPTIGDNSAGTSFAKDQLKAIIERIERLEEGKRALSDDIRDVYTEAKGNGFDVKALRTIVRLRKQDADQRAEHEAILEVYMHALGMLADTPLGQAALSRVAADVSSPPFAIPDDEDRLRVPDEAS